MGGLIFYAIMVEANMAADKNKTAGKKKPKELYLKIPYHILNITDVNLCEKVILAHIYSFGEKGCWQPIRPNKLERAMLVVLLINQKDYELCPVNHILCMT